MLGERPERKEQLVELVDDQGPSPEVPPRSKRERKGRGKGDVKRGATTTRAMEKRLRVRIFKKMEVKRDDSIEHFLPTGVRSAC